MTQKNTGGPAFPGKFMEPDIGDPDTGEVLSFREEEHPGMTLRDYFAAQCINRIPYDPRTGYSHQAAEAYRMADAMIEARDK